jgi:hypothetical protein
LFEDQTRAVKHAFLFELLTWCAVTFLRGVLAGAGGFQPGLSSPPEH